MQTLEQKRKWNKKNAKKLAKQKREWRKNNRDKIKEYKKRSWIKHGKEISKRRKEKLLANPELLEKNRRKKRDFYYKNRKRILKINKERRLLNIEEHRKRVREYRRKKRSVYFLYSIKQSAKKQKLLFNLDKEWIKEKFEKGICEVTGIKFDMENYRSANSPSVDRINPKGNYTKDNCRVILWSLNKALCNLGQDYMLDVFEKFLRKVSPEKFKKKVSYK